MKYPYIETINEIQKSFIDKFNNSANIQYEYVSCPSCKTKKNIHLYDNDRYRLKHSVVICLNCTLIYANPRMTSSSLEEFYSSGVYRNIYTNISKEEEMNLQYSNFSYEFSKPNYKTYHQFLSHDFLIDKEIKFSNVAEIGCGYGLNLKAFKMLGKETFGLEPDKEIEEFVKKKLNINIKNGFYKDLQGKFDLIFVKHVFEHLPDPKHFLKDIRKNTNKYLYIEVPGNYKQLQSIQNAHTMFFSSNTLIDLVVSESFNLEYLEISKDNGFILSLFSIANKKNKFYFNKKLELTKVLFWFCRSFFSNLKKKLNYFLHNKCKTPSP
jgi:SAM-dependent methyltransferase